jgi:kynurenine formamidase
MFDHKLEIKVSERKYLANLNNPIDISIPLRAGEENVNAWHSPPVLIEAVIMGDWIGDVSKGGSVNFRNVRLNPHGNGTHTECVGHISAESYHLNDSLKKFHFISQLISVEPEQYEDDLIITPSKVKDRIEADVEALVIRTLPNDNSKLKRKYTGTNPPYLTGEAIAHIRNKGVKHLLVDVPSVDREQDDGKLLAHHQFWNYPADPDTEATITELIYVPDDVKDGLYLLNLQITSIENDASPSKPVLFPLYEQ